MKNDFFDDLKMTETFAAFCGDGLSFNRNIINFVSVNVVFLFLMFVLSAFSIKKYY